MCIAGGRASTQTGKRQQQQHDGKQQLWGAQQSKEERKFAKLNPSPDLHEAVDQCCEGTAAPHTTTELLSVGDEEADDVHDFMAAWAWKREHLCAFSCTALCTLFQSLLSRFRPSSTCKILVPSIHDREI